MSGICGLLYLDDTPARSEEIAPMVDSLRHRGPDQGAVIAEGICGLGNRRLATIDRSADLPMRSADDQLVLAYDGAIYNHREIRRHLTQEGQVYRTGSDAEALLHLYRRYDTDMLRSLRGMFAFALWDRANRRLLLARDRMGEKPLYYYQNAHIFAFASEIKALLAHPAVPRESAIDGAALARYLAYGYFPTPETAFRDIKMLPPGCLISIREGRAQITPYWTLPTLRGAERLTASFEAEKLGAVREAIGEAVRQSLTSDVPLGAFLSGGLDSSLIVALMRHHSNADIQTFSLSFEGGDSLDETDFARQVASHLHTDHVAFMVKPQALDLLPLLVWHHDQPFGDSSAIPTYLASKLTREHVTVALTGNGCDELFAGYDRFYALELVRRLDVLPHGLWSSAARLLNTIPESTNYYSVVNRTRRFLHGAALPPALAYFDFVRLFDACQIAQLTRDFAEAADQHYLHCFDHPDQAALTELLAVNMRTNLADDLLIRSDRSSMAVSLETRNPLLDHWLVEMAATIPINLKLHGSTTKYILKRLGRELLPAEIVQRPKYSFKMPLGAWLRQDINPVREVLLSPEARARGLLDSAAVAALIDEHMSGRRDHGQRLWSLLTLEWWHRLFIDPAVIHRP